jgi:hypothetical protein
MMASSPALLGKRARAATDHLISSPPSASRLRHAAPYADDLDLRLSSTLAPAGQQHLGCLGVDYQDDHVRDGAAVRDDEMKSR